MQQGSRLKNAFNALFGPSNSANFVGAQSLGTWNPINTLLNHYHSDAYASAYPSIRAIANEYMTVRPFAIDKNGKKVPHPVIDALYHPNQADSSVAFAEKIAVATLALPKTYVLVWRREGREAKAGGDFTTDTIGGFTFLEGMGITRREGKTYYNVGAQEFTEDEVLVLPGGVNAHSLYEGYSPTEAARRWIKLDDYIADYQAGFFENGAVPAGQFIITAATKTQFDDIVDTLQKRHRGAGKNGNVTYAHRPVDPATNKPIDAQIEWVPFAQSNKDIDFKNLFEQTNKRIDLAYGVPQIVKGVDDAATYANAQVAERGFSKRAVFPLLLRNYTQLTHELNRITNGLGVAISFEYDIPTVSDEELVDAQRKVADTSVITTMTTAGYSLDSVVDAFELPLTYKLLKTDNSQPVIDDDKPDVDEGNEVDESPDPDKIDGVTPLNNKPTRPKSEKSNKEKIEEATRNFMQAQIDIAVAALPTEDSVSNAVDAPTKEQSEALFIDEVLATVVTVMVAEGELQYPEGVALLEAAGVSTESLTDFVLSDSAQDEYRAYLKRVGGTYSDETAESIRNILADANESGWTRKETEEALQNIMNTDDWRVTRLARSELNRAESMGGLESMKQIQNQSGYTFEKALSHAGNPELPCEFCQALDDQWVKVNEPVVALNQVVDGVDGGTYVNDFTDLQAGDVHPNGKGHMEYRLAS